MLGKVELPVLITSRNGGGNLSRELRERLLSAREGGGINGGDSMLASCEPLPDMIGAYSERRDQTRACDDDPTLRPGRGGTEWVRDDAECTAVGGSPLVVLGCYLFQRWEKGTPHCHRAESLSGGSLGNWPWMEGVNLLQTVHQWIKDCENGSSLPGEHPLFVSHAVLVALLTICIFHGTWSRTREPPFT